MYSDNLLPINAVDQERVGRYRFVVYSTNDGEYWVRAYEQGGQSFTLKNDNGQTELFTNELCARSWILRWLGFQTIIGERIEAAS